MFLDIVVYQNKQEWLLWSIYKVGINIADFTMIVALITDRDVLGLIRFKRYLAKKYKSLFSK
ncbi:hypothetical protein PULV_a3950 [Pseudoalteromonas ulvae UL12]|nr:hypothetical protein [Pseudoalteromonas ulvae UL12]